VSLQAVLEMVGRGDAVSLLNLSIGKTVDLRLSKADAPGQLRL
jgi:hypothetical protein